MNKIKKIFKFIFYVFSPIALGTVVGLLINTKSYKLVNRPPLSPPSIVFPIAWSILYLLMGISAYIIYKNEGKNKLRFYWIQLFINLAWSFIFFTFKLYYLGIIWILILLYFVSKMIDDFKEIKKVAAYLQLPYFFWLLFALYLNIGVALLN